MKIILILIAIVTFIFVSRLVMQNITAPSHLGHKAGQLAPMPDKPNAVSSQTDIVDKRVDPLQYKADAEDTMSAVIDALSSMGNNEIQEQQSHYIYSVFTTPKLHFHDDVEILLDEQTKQVHFRSQSRAGHSDLGVNRQRYDQFKALYNK
ncbi:hypothetical protein GCM10007916_31460 [Psychromonas marina]|uniref:DUF1499 domain-containing protein n=1 Tax=Psychromonas marina TaxID=88364 RepID=A0ABQ6E408_9GAMM|nr:DUF1499 domain-containing protein [Psychromonas marina]GLS92076.1 hypothetical protein GCM10007916_31460 [Psychromonas marina]